MVHTARRAFPRVIAVTAAVVAALSSAPAGAQAPAGAAATARASAARATAQAPAAQVPVSSVPAQPAAQAPVMSTQDAPAAQAPRREPARYKVPMDPARARELYVSNDPKHHSPGHDFQRDIDQKQAEDARYPELCKGLIDFSKVTYRSSVGNLEIPAYVFQPLQKRGPKGHAAMVWVHGGVHGNWGITMFPFVKEAVERGYVVVAPEYRGSIGYGEAHHRAIDYGGYEVDDVVSAYDYLATLAHVDPDRVGIMGWSHGGYITLLSVFRDVTPFKAAAAIVPVTNLVFRLSYKGPSYQWEFSTQERLRGLPYEKREEYIRRSPLYHVDKLNTPLLVHIATNDTDVDFVECQQIVDALRSRKPDLAETKVYVDPAPWGQSVGHSFSRRVDPKTLQRVDSPAQIDSWNRVWTLFDWHLRPYEDRSRPPAPAQP
jgi:dipeptidyl aminopeptidase/acylaminoacyl peptidase